MTHDRERRVDDSCQSTECGYVMSVPDDAVCHEHAVLVTEGRAHDALSSHRGGVILLAS